MEENFRKVLLKGAINVACKSETEKDSDGNPKIMCVWRARKEDIISAVRHIANKSAQTGYDISIRGVYYKLVAQNLIPNYRQAYKKLGDIIRDARYAGVLDWDVIKIDGARSKQIQYAVDGVDDALEDTIEKYKLDRQAGQSNYIEVWCEKDTLVDLLRTITDKYHIPLCIAKGRQSTSAIYKAYQRARHAVSEGRQVKLIYVGDHDPDGLDMIRDVKDRINEMLESSQTHYENCGLDYKYHLTGALEVIPAALTLDQIRQYNLPPNYAKETSACYKKYVKTYKTTECWEVDALDNEILHDIVEKHILDLINVVMYTNIIEQEKADRETLREFIDNR